MDELRAGTLSTGAATGLDGDDSAAIETTVMREKLLTYDEVAEILGVTYMTVWRWVDAGKIEALKLGGCVRIQPKALEEFLERSKKEDIPSGVRRSLDTTIKKRLLTYRPRPLKSSKR